LQISSTGEESREKVEERGYKKRQKRKGEKKRWKTRRGRREKW
jgi:hypothetical protein